MSEKIALERIEAARRRNATELDLQAIWLDENQLTVRPASMTQLTQLHTLHLSHNQTQNTSA